MKTLLTAEINEAYIKELESVVDIQYAGWVNTQTILSEEEMAALVQALRDRRIAGAAVDVFESEPLSKDHPFVTELDNVVITPHLAGATYDAIDKHTLQLVCDVKHFVKGEPLEYEYI